MRGPIEWYKEPWFWVCYDAGVGPALATADDVLGDFEERLRTGAGDRVLLEGELRPRADSEGPNSPLEEAEWLYPESATEYECEVTCVQEVAGLTKREAEVVEFIMSGTPLSSGYAVFVGSVLGMRPGTVREHWRTARKKLQTHWSGDS